MARVKKTKPPWTARDIEILKTLFPNNPTAAVAKKLGRRADAVKKKASRMKIRKSRRYLKSIRRA